MDRYAKQSKKICRCPDTAREASGTSASCGPWKKLPRHLFIDEGLIDQAYNDNPLPIGEKKDHLTARHRGDHDGSRW